MGPIQSPGCLGPPESGHSLDTLSPAPRFAPAAAFVVRADLVSLRPRLLPFVMFRSHHFTRLCSFRIGGPQPVAYFDAGGPARDGGEEDRRDRARGFASHHVSQIAASRIEHAPHVIHRAAKFTCESVAHNLAGGLNRRLAGNENQIAPAHGRAERQVRGRRVGFARDR